MLICDLLAIEPASSSIPAAAATMTGWGVFMAALFTLQQQRAIAVNPERSNLILALNNSALYLGASWLWWRSYFYRSVEHRPRQDLPMRQRSPNRMGSSDG
jgi:hypothetical protein